MPQAMFGAVFPGKACGIRAGLVSKCSFNNEHSIICEQ